MTFRSTLSEFFSKNVLSKFRESVEKRTEAAEKKKKDSAPPLEAIDSTEIQSIAGILGGADKNPDEILRTKGVSVYDEMEAKDSHIYSVYQTRKLAIAMTPWEIYPADDSKKAKEIAEFVFTALDDCRGTFAEDIKQLLDAIGKGFAILEIVWKLKDSGRWRGKYMIEELLFHKQKYWFFKDRRWHKSEESVALFGKEAMRGKPVPWEKIIHYAYDAEDNLYGRAAFKPIYYLYWIKKEGWKSWIIFLNKYGTPTTVGKYPKGTKKPDQDRLLEIVETIQEETGVIIPDKMDISFLEASHAGTASYRDLADACNAEISKAILGATQTVEEGRRGSYALSRAHSEVRRERVEADSIEVSDVIQQQLVKRLVDFNFITDAYPQFIMKPFVGKDTPLPAKKTPIAKLPAEKVIDIPGKVPEELPEEVIEVPKIEETPEGSKKEKTPKEKILEIPEELLPEVSSELREAFKRIKESVSKSYGKNHFPVINVGPIKKILKDSFDEEKAFDLAKHIKAFIEMKIEPDNIEEVFEEALEQLSQEMKK